MLPHRLGRTVLVVASLDEDQLLDALDEAIAAQIIKVESGEDFIFTHDNIREVLYEELNPIRRRRMHQRIGESLEKIYREFHRVLKSGGEVRIYPTPDLDLKRVHRAGLRKIMREFEIGKVFTARWLNPGKYPPAYMMTMTKK